MKIKGFFRKSGVSGILTLRRRLIAFGAVALVTGLAGAAIYSTVRVGMAAEGDGVALGGDLEINPEYERYMRDVENGEGDKWGVVPMKYRTKRKQTGVNDTGEATERPTAGTFPTSYSLIDAGYGTTIKNQSMDGDCWAFATTTVMESHLKKKGITYEFSPKQMDYLLANGSSGTVYARSLAANQGFSRDIADGGNIYTLGPALGGTNTQILDSAFFDVMKTNDPTLNSFTSWKDYNTVVTEMLLFGKEMSAYTRPMAESSIMLENPEYLVTGLRTGTAAEISRDIIKQEIYSNTTDGGAVWVATVWPASTGSVSNACWDATSKTVMGKLDTATNMTPCTGGGHALAIVGWDDDHTYTDGGVTKKGAFLLQNSWGKKSDFNANDLISRGLATSSELTPEVQSNFANADMNEYLWLAYDYSDTVWYGIIGDVVKNDYKKIYDSVANSATMTSDATSVTHAYAKSGSEKEYIDAIGVNVTAESIVQGSVSVQISVDKDGSGSFENVGTVALCETGKGCGRATLKLSKQIPVTSGYKIKVSGIAFNEVVGANHISTTVYMAEGDGSSDPPATTNVKYTVRHFKQQLDGSYSTTPDETEAAVTVASGTSVTPTAKSYPGFTVDASTTGARVITADTNIDVKYTRNSYTVAITKGEGIATASGAASYKFGATVSLNATLAEGYENITWSGAGLTTTTGPAMSFSMPANNVTVTVSATRKGEEPGPVDPPVDPPAGEVAYRVEHYKQKLDESYDTTPTDSEAFTATAGTPVTPERKTYEGFSKPAEKTETVAADGSTVIRYYYERNSYTVKIVKGEGISEVTGEGRYKYEALVGLVAFAETGYENITWTGDYTSGSFYMPAKDVMITVTAKKKAADPQPDPKPTPTDPKPTPEPEDPMGESDVKVPDTGAFTVVEIGARIIGAVIVIGIVLGIGFGIYTYRQKQSTIKINFDDDEE